jgi:hypothetical protein
MRSLKSLREKRACGPQNFQHLRQNDFCNSIHSKADIPIIPRDIRYMPQADLAKLLRESDWLR